MAGEHRRRTRLAACALLPAMLLASCGGAADEAGAVSADEAAQLNDAAAMLDANSVALDAVTSNRPETAP